MTRWKVMMIASITAGAAVVVGCESDEFSDAPTVQASQAGGERMSDQADYQQDSPGDRSESAGPIQGRERPPNHPTLQGGSESSAEQVAPPQVERPSPQEYGQVGPIRWEAPSQWSAAAPENRMRYAQYDISEDGQSAQLVVFYFGNGGGGVEDNLQRWAGQFHDGTEPKRDRRQVEGMTVHLLDVAGTYQTDMPMAGGDEPTEEQRLLGAIAETSKGLFFFRLLGDEPLVSGHAEAFDGFVDSLHEGPG